MQMLLTRTLAGIPPPQRGDIERVSAFCTKHLSGMQRRSGEAYAEHCHEVASVVREVSDNPDLLCAALLHDLPLHPDVDELLPRSPLSQVQRDMVMSMHRVRRLHIDAKTKDLDTVLRVFTSDQRLLPLRMAHRLNDVRHLKRFSVSLARRISRETLHMYSAIAGRLSMHQWRHEMEDTCFLFLQTATANNLRQQFAHFAPSDRQCLKHTQALLQKELAARDIAATVSTRTKTLYSSYRKMIVKRRRLEELTDRLAVRIVTKTVDECYRALGAVHASLHPIPGKLKDYIGAPKENGYQSIHTVVYPLPGVTEYPVEIQIRTEDMHQACEYGAAKHADYKHCLYGLQSRFARIDLFNNLLVLRESAHSPEQFATLLRTYFSDNQVVLFDGDGGLHHMRSPLTALDFGCQTAGLRIRFLKNIRVNGRTASFDTALKDGDTVECQFGRTVLSVDGWEKWCRQTSSKKHLRSVQRDHATQRSRKAKVA